MHIILKSTKTAFFFLHIILPHNLKRLIFLLAYDKLDRELCQESETLLDIPVFLGAADEEFHAVLVGLLERLFFRDLLRQVRFVPQKDFGQFVRSFREQLLDPKIYVFEGFWVCHVEDYYRSILYYFIFFYF